MGSRKHLRAEKMKEARQDLYFARLSNVPTSPRKMRKVAELIKGEKVENALHILEHSPQEAAIRLRKLLLSAIANWQAKNEGQRLEDKDLYVKTVMVDGARVLKRIQPAPQGRAYRIRKRSNHVTITLGDRSEQLEEINQ
jgi:large subunit ribosomal protein L22